MSCALGPVAKQQFLSVDGIPIVGGHVYIYEAGGSTPAATYTSYAGTVAAPWPLVLDSNGETEIWISSGLYKMVLTDENDVQLWTVDQITSAASGGSGASFVMLTTVGTSDSLKSLGAGVCLQATTLGYRTAGDGGGGSFRWVAGSTEDGDDAFVVIPVSAPATGRWLRLVEGSSVDIRWSGAWGTGSDDDGPFFSVADSYASAHGMSVFVSEGDYLWTTEPTHAATLVFGTGGMAIWSGYHPAFSFVITDAEQHFSTIDSDTDYPIFRGGTAVRPEWFGAAADGAAEDTEETQSAFNSLQAGGKIDLSDGTYLMATGGPAPNLMLHDRLEVAGRGPGTVLKFKSGYATDYGLLGNLSETDGVWLHDFKIDGNKAGQSVGTGIKMWGRNTHIENVWVSDCLDCGIELNQSFDGTGNNAVAYCTVSDSSIGISADGWRDGRIWGNTVCGGDITGISSTDGNRLVISENKIYGTKGVGISESGDASYGLNYISGVTDAYDVPERFIDVGNSLSVQIDGDATAVNGLRCGNDVEIRGRLVVGDSTLGYGTDMTYLDGDATCTDLRVMHDAVVDGTMICGAFAPGAGLGDWVVPNRGTSITDLTTCSWWACEAYSGSLGSPAYNHSYRFESNYGVTQYCRIGNLVTLQVYEEGPGSPGDPFVDSTMNISSLRLHLPADATIASVGQGIWPVFFKNRKGGNYDSGYTTGIVQWLSSSDLLFSYGDATHALVNWPVGYPAGFSDSSVTRWAASLTYRHY